MLTEAQEFASGTLLTAMRSIACEAAIEWEELMSYPALGRDQSSTIERLGSALGSTGQPIKPTFDTEAGHFAKRGNASIVCDPGHVDVAHKSDEYVEISQLYDCTAFFRALAGEGAAASSNASIQSYRSNT